MRELDRLKRIQAVVDEELSAAEKQSLTLTLLFDRRSTPMGYAAAASEMFCGPAPSLNRLNSLFSC
jgi:hypothetical protein